MIIAGHFPRHHFTAAELLAMPLHEKGTWSEPGWHRTTDDRGKPLVFYHSDTFRNDPRPHCVVRPVVRVKAPSRRVTAQCCLRPVSMLCRGCPLSTYHVQYRGPY